MSGRRIGIVNVQTPFVRGGAEMHADNLVKAVRHAGHEADLITLPFKSYPPQRILDHMLAYRLLDLTESVHAKIDTLICLKFPSYVVAHPDRRVWLLHQHRSAYDLWRNPMGDLGNYHDGNSIREAIEAADNRHLREANRLFTNSQNVSKRLKQYNGIEADPLYHPPPGASSIYTAEAQDFLFYPSRLTPVKRQELVLKALQHTKQDVVVRLAGRPDSPSHMKSLEKLTAELGVQDRVHWMGGVTDEEMLELYANCLGVVYPPTDEDYGYVTLEGMLASKPVITCRDSGGPLEFVREGETGLIARARPEELAEAMDTLWADRSRAAEMGRAGRAAYEAADITWENAVGKLLG